MKSKMIRTTEGDREPRDATCYRNAIQAGYLNLPHEGQKLQDGQSGKNIPRYSNYNQQNITMAAPEGNSSRANRIAIATQ
jgi:hypothetical protein